MDLRTSSNAVTSVAFKLTHAHKPIHRAKNKICHQQGRSTIERGDLKLVYIYIYVLEANAIIR